MQETFTVHARTDMNFLQLLTVKVSWRGTCIYSLLEEDEQMSFGLYLLGYLLFVIGVAYGAHLANVPQNWIGVIVIAMVGIGIMMGVSRTRTRDPQ
jgi:hypothetical protein